MSKGERAARIIGLILVVIIVAGLRIWLSLDHSQGVYLAVVIILLVLVGFAKAIFPRPAPPPEPAPPPPPKARPRPRKVNLVFVYNYKKYTSLESMPHDARQAYLKNLEQSGVFFPDSFAQQLALLGRPDLAEDFQRSYQLYTESRLTKADLDHRVQNVVAIFNEGIPPEPVKSTPLLLELTYNGKVYTTLESLTPPARAAYRDLLVATSRETPMQFEDLLEDRGLRDLAEMHRESRRQLELTLIYEEDMQITRRQVIDAIHGGAL